MLTRSLNSFSLRNSDVNQNIEKKRLSDEYKSIKKSNPLRNSSTGYDFFNEYKNRYTDVVAKNKTRVTLKGLDVDYINANHIKYQGQKYISTQAPLKNTRRDFWKMVYDQKSPVIVMLTKCKSGKAEKYWPSTQIKPKTYNYWSGQTSDEDIEIKVTLENTIELDVCVLRVFNLSYNGDIKMIYHIQYTQWGDHKVPHHPEHINDLIRYMELFQVLGERNGLKGPPIIHCSAGIGRAGTFISCSIVKTLKLQRDNVDIPDIVKTLRECRDGMVQTGDQYFFIHQFIHHN